MTKAHEIKAIKVWIGDKGCDGEKNHEYLRDELGALPMIPARYQDVPMEDKGKVQEGDEDGLLEEGVSPEVHKIARELIRQDGSYQNLPATVCKHH